MGSLEVRQVTPASQVGSPRRAYNFAMHPIIESRRQEVTDLCHRQQVRRLEVFGSATRDDFDAARSDLDFLVDLGTDGNRASPLDAYFDLKDALESLFGRRVDLVSVGSVRNPYVEAEIERERQLLFAKE